MNSNIRNLEIENKNEEKKKKIDQNQTSNSAEITKIRQEEEERRQEEVQNKKIFQTKLKKIMGGNYALHYKRLAQIYINFDQFKNLFLGIKKSREDVENILKNAQRLPSNNPTPLQQPKQPWEDWDNGELQLSKDGDMVSVKGHVYIRVGNRYEPFNTSTATLYTQDGCLSGSWSLAAKKGQEYKYVSHTEAMKRQMNRQIFYTGQELEDIKQKLKTRYRDAIRMRFVNEFLSNKDRLFKSRCVELLKAIPMKNTNTMTSLTTSKSTRCTIETWLQKKATCYAPKKPLFVLILIVVMMLKSMIKNGTEKKPNAKRTNRDVKGRNKKKIYKIVETKNKKLFQNNVKTKRIGKNK